MLHFLTHPALISGDSVNLPTRTIVNNLVILITHLKMSLAILIASPPCSPSDPDRPSDPPITLIYKINLR